MKRTRLGVLFAIPLLALVVRSASSAPAKKAPAAAASSASASASTSASIAPEPPGPKPLSETLTGDAKTDFEQGGVAYKNGDYGGALVKLRSA